MRLAMHSILVLGLIACGADRAADLAAGFSARRYVIGVGRSTKGAAAAEADARAQVARQLHSSLRAQVQVVEGERDGRRYGGARTSVIESTAFTQGELIRIVRDRTHCGEGICVALAVLERAAAVERLERIYLEKRVPFDKALAAAQAAAQDPRRFTHAFTAMERAWSALPALARQLAAAAAHPYEAFERDRARREALLAARLSLLAANPITLLPGTIAPPEARDPVRAALAAAFRAAGVATSTGERCRAGLGFEPTAKIRCRPSALGRRCAVHLGGTLRRCEGAELARFDLSGLRAVGMHPSDEARARRCALERLEGAALTKAVRRGLKGVLPLGAP